MENLLLDRYKAEMQDELQALLQYWQYKTLDGFRGGFIGEINYLNMPNPMAPKGAILNARILWSFAAGYDATQNGHYLELATRAYEYLVKHFLDSEFGGVFWSVDCEGKPLNEKKQTYAISFAIYAFANYYVARPDQQVKMHAIELYKLLIKYAYDELNGGFTEAFTRQWHPLDDLRLSEKDANTPKSMNTMLHVMEAFSSLYAIWPSEELRLHLQKILHQFSEFIINKKTKHLNLFFDMDWTVRSNDISFGHDIEASWLLVEAAEVTENKMLIEAAKKLAVEMAEATKKGLDHDGALWYETNATYSHWIREKHWWPQAEAMVGFLNAFELTGDENYLHLSYNVWAFVKKSLKDDAGEWHWGVDLSGGILPKDKVGFWKCPYHNTRACLEVIKRINRIKRVD